MFTANELLDVLNCLKDAIFIEDEEGMVLWCNKACEQMYELSREELIGSSIRDLEEKGIFSPSATRKVLEDKKEVTIFHENRLGKQLLSTGVPMLNKEGEIIKIVTTSQDISELSRLQDELEKIQKRLDTMDRPHKYSDDEIVAVSQPMYNVLQLAKRLAEVDSTVLITGESGVGKGLIAKYLHKNGARKEKAFVAINCGAIPENLMESELFGYESGAFTGSRTEGKVGLFETAKGGTLFLDEISELPLNLQVKLLQVIQDREFKKVGGVKSIPVDVRIVSATNRDLRRLVGEGKFREDLFYRLNVVPINVPPLRERREDILPLIQNALYILNEKMGDNKSIEPSALAILLTYEWPGNVREVENIIERLMITTRGSVITQENLPPYILSNANNMSTKGKEELTLREAVNQLEKEILQESLIKYKTTRKIAKILGVSQPTVVRKMEKYGVSVRNDTD